MIAPHTKAEAEACRGKSSYYIYIYIDLNCISWSSDDHHRSSHLEHQAAIMGHRQVAGVRTNFAPALLPMSISGSWQGGNRRITGLEGTLLVTYRKPIDFCRSNMSNIVQLYFFCPSGRFSSWEFPKESFNRFWTQESELTRQKVGMVWLWSTSFNSSMISSCGSSSSSSIVIMFINDY